MKRPSSPAPVSHKRMLLNRVVFVEEADALFDIKVDFPDFVRNGDVQAVAEALDNSLFRRYLKLNRELQEEAWTAAEGCYHPYELYEYLKDVIALEVRQSYPVEFDGGEEEDDEEDEEDQGDDEEDGDSLFVKEADALFNLTENFPDYVHKGDLDAVARALENSLFERYLRYNKDLQEKAWRAAEGRNHPYKMYELLKDVVALEIRQKYPVDFDEGEDDDEEKEDEQ